MLLGLRQCCCFRNLKACFFVWFFFPHLLDGRGFAEDEVAQGAPVNCVNLAAFSRTDDGTSA
jgi:hypothetical protein